MNDYDLEHVYNDQIAPLMAQIVAICWQYGMPLLVSCAYAHDEAKDATRYYTTLVEINYRPLPEFRRAQAVIRQVEEGELP